MYCIEIMIGLTFGFRAGIKIDEDNESMLQKSMRACTSLSLRKVKPSSIFCRSTSCNCFSFTESKRGGYDDIHIIVTDIPSTTNSPFIHLSFPGNVSDTIKRVSSMS